MAPGDGTKAGTQRMKVNATPMHGNAKSGKNRHFRFCSQIAFSQTRAIAGSICRFNRGPHIGYIPFGHCVCCICGLGMSSTSSARPHRSAPVDLMNTDTCLQPRQSHPHTIPSVTSHIEVADSTQKGLSIRANAGESRNYRGMMLFCSVFLCVLSLHSIIEETVMQRLDTALKFVIRTHVPCPGSLKALNSFVGVELPCQLWVAELGRPQTTWLHRPIHNSLDVITIARRLRWKFNEIDEIAARKPLAAY